MSERIASIVSSSLAVKQQFFDQHGDKVEQAARMISESFRDGGKLLLCGNGGSSCDAQHIAGEFVNRFIDHERRGLPALALSTDGGVVTCIANDTGYEKVFSRQVEAFARPGDILLAISTSGTSANVLAAVEQARVSKIRTIGLLGRDGGTIGPLCDLALVVASKDTQRIQEAHNLIGHIICELVEETVFPKEISSSAKGS